MINHVRDVFVVYYGIMGSTFFFCIVYILCGLLLYRLMDSDIGNKPKQ